MYQSIISDEHYWLEKLEAEFYLSREEAKAFKDKMQCSYEQIYLFCNNDTFEDFTEIFCVSYYDDCLLKYEQALKKSLGEEVLRIISRVNPRLFQIKINSIEGLTYTNLRGRFLHRSEEIVLSSILKLITDCQMDIRQAFKFRFDIIKQNGDVEDSVHSFKMTNDNYVKKYNADLLNDYKRTITSTLYPNSNPNDPLTEEQFNQIIDNDLQGLNKFHIVALRELGKYGLKSIHVRNAGWFNSNAYVDVLSKLLIEQQYSVMEALQFLHGLTPFKVYGLSKGLSLKEVINLKNEIHVDALLDLKDKGITAEQIQKLDWFKYKDQLEALKILLKYLSFDYITTTLANLTERLTVHHLVALSYLLDKCEAKEALNIIATKLNERQALCITDDIPLGEIIGLNEAQAAALRGLYQNGLRGNHVRNQAWFNCPYHNDVLCYLVRKLKFTIEDALHTIKNSSWLDILNMMKALSKLEFNNLNQYQIMALLFLNRCGLKKEHLEGCEWFNSIKHKDDLIALIVEQKMSPDDAMKQLQMSIPQSEPRDIQISPAPVF